MNLGSDHQHNYPERGCQGSKPDSPAGKEPRRWISNPLPRQKIANRGLCNRCSPLSDCAAKPNLER